MNKQTIETLLKLGVFFQETNIQYGITGSFVINTSPYGYPNDVDLYIEQTSVIHDHLLHSLGFICVEREDLTYRDNLTIRVWRHSKALIDIQVMKDFELKTKAQNFILNLPRNILERLSSSKAGMSSVWNWAIDEVQKAEAIKAESVLPEEAKRLDYFVDEFGKSHAYDGLR